MEDIMYNYNSSDDENNCYFNITINGVSLSSEMDYLFMGEFILPKDAYRKDGSKVDFHDLKFKKSPIYNGTNISAGFTVDQAMDAWSY
ncbi:MAG: hypothetical protein LBD03_07255 [Methanobrevibacter sp.]|nr:hypothetical protein [Candidatus Methanovirga procula]